MFIRITGYLVGAAVVSIGVWYFGEQTYDRFQYASQTAQKSLEVTEEQTAELRSSAIKSDMIIWGTYGLVFAAWCGFWCPVKLPAKRRAIGAVGGAFLGIIAGISTAQIGHWYDHTIPFPPDPMLYWFGRWALMLLPLAVAAGAAAGIVGSKRDCTEGMVGAILGMLLSVTVYCLACGAISEIEGHQYVYPGFSKNRILILITSSFLIGGGVLLRTAGTDSQPEKSQPEQQQ